MFVIKLHIEYYRHRRQQLFKMRDDSVYLTIKYRVPVRKSRITKIFWTHSSHTMAREIVMRINSLVIFMINGAM